MSHALNIHDGSGEIAKDPSLGILHAYGTTVPANGVAGYAPGCRFIKVNGNSVGTVSWINIGTKASAAFVAEGVAAGTNASFVWGEGTIVDQPFWIADKAYTVTNITARVIVAGTDGGAVTGTIRRVPTATAIASGTALHSGTINLKGTVDANQVLTLAAASELNISAGNALALDLTGVPTAARGVVSVGLLPT